MGHSTTTFGRIVRLYDEERMLLDKEELTDAERGRFAEIRTQLESLWPKERQERVFLQHGRPRLISAPDPSRRRQVARGIQPLPATGGD